MFEPVPPCRRRSSRFVTNSKFSKRTRHLVCASSAPTGSSGSCSRAGGPVGAVACTSFAPIQLSLGTAERSRGTGRGSHAGVGKTERSGRNSPLDSGHEPSDPIVVSRSRLATRLLWYMTRTEAIVAEARLILSGVAPGFSLHSPFCDPERRCIAAARLSRSVSPAESVGTQTRFSVTTAGRMRADDEIWNCANLC